MYLHFKINPESFCAKLYATEKTNNLNIQNNSSLF